MSWCLQLLSEDQVEHGVVTSELADSVHSFSSKSESMSKEEQDAALLRSPSVVRKREVFISQFNDLKTKFPDGAFGVDFISL
ncbi:hypothetical protein V6N12_054726 [Hibiscus sabdariffa]|uniref:Uncharacterized protein n=1 Tax=Hibiscus sabdariffa TaxID=183260 RepID=A0ABR2D335_9ROSI